MGNRPPFHSKMRALSLLASTLLVGSVSAYMNCYTSRFELQTTSADGIGMGVQSVACNGKCISAKYVAGTGCPNTYIRLGCATEMAGSLQTDTTNTTTTFYQNMCGQTVPYIINIAQTQTYKVKYVCSTPTNPPPNTVKDAKAIITGQPNKKDFECNTCNTDETREQKSAVVALLLQLFLGQFAAGIFYYGDVGLGVGLIFLGFAPCICCCCLCMVTAVGSAGGNAMRGGGGAVEAPELEDDELAAPEVGTSLTSMEGTGTGTGSGAGKGGNDEMVGAMGGMVYCGVICAILATQIIAIVYVILIATYGFLPDTTKYCVKKM